MNPNAVENQKFSLFLNGTSSMNDVALEAFANDNNRSHQCSFMIEVNVTLLAIFDFAV